MMNYIWGAMLLLGICFAAVTGSSADFTQNIMDGCTNAITFILSLAGIMAMWSGIMKIAEESGMISKIAALTKPIMRFLFPNINNEQTSAMMIMSFMANIFGAGNSATVFSLKAMELLDKENNYSSSASNEMCMFVAMTMSMVQLVPITIIKIRSDLGSVSPEDIILPSIAAGLISMVISVWICKYHERKNSYV